MYLDTKTELFKRLAKVNNRNNEYALYIPTFFFSNQMVNLDFGL